MPENSADFGGVSFYLFISFGSPVLFSSGPARGSLPREQRAKIQKPSASCTDLHGETVGDTERSAAAAASWAPVPFSWKGLGRLYLRRPCKDLKCGEFHSSYEPKTGDVTHS